MVKVMGMLTLESVPGLNRHCRNAVVEFFLPQTPVERPAEAAARESEYLRVEELLQAEQARLPQPEVVAVEDPRPALRAAAKLQPPSGGSLKQHRAPSRNTIEAAA